MDKITQNIFRKLRNTDTNSADIGIEQYLEAHNLEIVGDGKFQALQNVSGTTHLQNLLAIETAEILEVLETKYLISGVLKNCLTIFSAVPSQTFKIWCYDISADTTYELYSEAIDSSYVTDDRVVDARNFPENGVDVVYFTDFFREIRAFKCEIPDPYSPAFLTAYDLSLQRRGANGTIALTSVGSGGTLLSGTYQIAYRMVDPTNKKFTKWSSLTNGIHVYDKANSTSPVYSGIGLPTTRKITLSITPSTLETDNFEYLQLAVIENVGPTIQDIDGVTTALPTTASLQEITAIPGTSLTFEYKSNSRIGTIPIEEITVDLAQIEKVKTLNVKENRLFLGNIHYTELEFDNGVPAVTGGSILSQADASVDSFSSDDFASRYKGYWRGEVYRLGVIYEDEFGNKSTVQPLDLSGVTGNAISGALDMKFPDRSAANTYTLFNSSGQIQSLGLRLTGLNNHPSWSKSVEIVRVKRKKNILFQTPVLPMSQVRGIGAVSRYPLTYSDEGGFTTVDSAQPQTSDMVLIPKNLFWPELRFIVRRGSSTTLAGQTVQQGEAQIQSNVGASVGHQFSMIWPTPNMYGDVPFVYTGAEKLDFVDYSLMRLNYLDSPPTKTPTVVTGDDVDTNVSGTFYATADGQYYFDSTFTGKSIPASEINVPITDYKYFDNLGSAQPVSGISALDYESLQTQGVDLGYKPNVQRSAVVKLGGTIIPEVRDKIFTLGTLNAYAAGGFVVGSSGIAFESAYTNNYLDEYTNYVSSTYFHGIPIANVKLGLGDDRYGDLYAQHEYISTGTKYTFTTSEVATLEGGGDVECPPLDVWGGDCFVGSHVFKVCDSTYSVTNQAKNNSSVVTLADVITKWEKAYRNSGDDAMCLPVAVRNSGQYIQVILESEYSEVREQDVLGSTVANIPVMKNDTINTVRTPLTYKYNLNLSKENDQKIYVPKLQFSFQQNEFGARVVYSDIKIYNSNQAGFDIFRVASFHDLEESRYPITKLAVGSDSLYAIQEKGITYLPTGARQVEETDAGTLSIRSGDVIGRPLTIDSERGSQHLRGIVETGGVIYIPDNQNKNIYALLGTEIKPITQNNETAFRTMFGNQLGERYVIGLYDPVRGEYWIAQRNTNTDCHIYNESNGWVGVYDCAGAFRGGVFTNQNLYLLGTLQATGDTSIYSMYTGAVNQIFETTVVPRVTFSINPDQNFAKTFDNIMIDASERLATIDFEIERETSLGNVSVTGTSLDSVSREGNFRLKTPRDSSGARLRGTRMLTTIKWGAIQSALRSVFTRYRLSSRTPF